MRTHVVHWTLLVAVSLGFVAWIWKGHFSMPEPALVARFASHSQSDPRSFGRLVNKVGEIVYADVWFKRNLVIRGEEFQEALEIIFVGPHYGLEGEEQGEFRILVEDPETRKPHPLASISQWHVGRRVVDVGTSFKTLPGLKFAVVYMDSQVATGSLDEPVYLDLSKSLISGSPVDVPHGAPLWLRLDDNDRLSIVS